MTKETMLLIAERDMKKAQRALQVNQNRKGITDAELTNLMRNAVYAEKVYKLIQESDKERF